MEDVVIIRHRNAEANHQNDDSSSECKARWASGYEGYAACDHLALTATPASLPSPFQHHPGFDSLPMVGRCLRDRFQ